MKKLLIFGVLLSCTTFVRAWNPPDATFGMTSDSKTLTLSTTPASPTQILTRDSFVQRTYLIVNSTFSVFISSTNTTISTSATNGAFALPNATVSNSFQVIWSPDGVNSPYNGALWAISQPGQTPQSISVFRSK